MRVLAPVLRVLLRDVREANPHLFDSALAAAAILAAIAVDGVS